MKRILAIETSCDETGIALVEGEGGTKNPGFRVLKEELSSQINIHRPYGGVVPNLAKREHIKNLPVLYKEIAGSGEKKFWSGVDEIAVTSGPGLEPALWAGITFARELGKKWNKPVCGVNHMEGHLYSVLLDNSLSFPRKRESSISGSRIKSGMTLFPAIALIVSGGHTILLKMTSMTSWKKLGETRDDAVGEAFDKVARLLGLPYPGGPEISKLAKKGKVNIEFTQPMLHSKDYDFSFSGLKTAVLYFLKEKGYAPERGKKIPAKLAADVAASFEKAAIGVLVAKTFRAADQYGAKSVWLSGGVAANELLRKELGRHSKKRGIPLLVPPKKWTTDNAAMIGAAAYMQSLKKKQVPLVAKGDLQI